MPSRSLVVIVNYKGKHLLKDCLESVLGQQGEEFDVLVVDNGSGDGSPEMLARDFPQVQVLALPGNLGLAHGLNQGMAASRRAYDTYVFLNNDTKADPGWLHELVKALRDDPQAGLCNSLVINANNG